MKEYTKTLALAWVIIFSVNALCSAMLIALINANWASMDGQGRFMVVVTILMNFTNTLGAFLYSILKKADPNDFGDLPKTVSSATITQTQTETVSESVQPAEIKTL